MMGVSEQQKVALVRMIEMTSHHKIKSSEQTSDWCGLPAEAIAESLSSSAAAAASSRLLQCSWQQAAKRAVFQTCVEVT